MIRAKFVYEGKLRGIPGLKRGDVLEIDGKTHKITWMQRTRAGDAVALYLDGMGVVFDHEIEPVGWGPDR